MHYKTATRRRLLALILAGCLATPISTRAGEPIPVTDFARPTLVTISVKDQDIESVRRALQQQSGFSLPITGVDEVTLAEHKLSLDCKDTPWLEVLMRFCEAAKIEPTISANNRWSLSAGGARHMLGPRDVQGPTMVALTVASIETVIDFDAVERTSLQLRLNGLLAIEPSVEIGDITGIADLRMTDDLGRELETSSIPVTRGRPSSFAHPQRYIGLRAPMPDRNAKKISVVSGKLTAPAVRKREAITIPDVLSSEGKRLAAGGRALLIEAVKQQTPQVYLVEVLIDSPYVPEHVFGWERQDPSRLYVKQTHGADPASVRVQKLAPAEGGTVVTLYVQFNQPGSDSAPEANRRLDLWWEMPSEFVDVSIPFRITEVPLP